MNLVTAKSMLVLPDRVRRRLQAQEASRRYSRQLLVFASIVGLPIGLAAGVTLGATGHSALIGAFFGLIIAGCTGMGIYAWHPLVFGAPPGWGAPSQIVKHRKAR